MTVVLTQPDDLLGLPADLIAAAKQAAVDRKLIQSEADKDVHVITLSRSLVSPFLTFSERRDLREKAWKLWTSRGEIDLEHRNNLKIASKMLRLRADQAKMHGYKTYAEYATADTMAGTPERVMELLEVRKRTLSYENTNNLFICRFTMILIFVLSIPSNIIYI